MMNRESEASFREFPDKSWIAQFPPGFFQKGMAHIKIHPDEQFVLQITETRIYLRRTRALVGGKRLKDRVNGQIITWAPAMIKELDKSEPNSA